MPNRVLKDAVWTSDKLAACRLDAPASGLWAPTVGDQARLAYGYCPILLQDDWGCFELNLRTIRIRCFSNFENPPSIEQLKLWFQLWNWNGLLFVWEEKDKPWAYVTGEEEGRLVPPTRRHLPHTPSLSHSPKKPRCEWPQVTKYLSTYKSLQSATDGLLQGYKVLQSTTIPLRAASASPQPTTVSLPLPTTDNDGPTVARAGANPDPYPDPNPKPDRTVSTASENTLEGHGTSSAKVSQILKDLAGSAGKNGSLRKKLEEGIHRNKLFNSYDDYIIEQESRGGTRELTEFVARGVLEEGVKLLLSSRGFRELGKVNSSQLVDAAWPPVQRGLAHLAHLKNYDLRKRQLGGHVINCVVNAALELQEQQ